MYCGEFKQKRRRAKGLTNPPVANHLKLARLTPQNNKRATGQTTKQRKHSCTNRRAAKPPRWKRVPPPDRFPDRANQSPARQKRERKHSAQDLPTHQGRRSRGTRKSDDSHRGLAWARRAPICGSHRVVAQQVSGQIGAMKAVSMHVAGKAVAAASRSIQRCQTRVQGVVTDMPPAPVPTCLQHRERPLRRLYWKEPELEQSSVDGIGRRCCCHTECWQTARAATGSGSGQQGHPNNSGQTRSGARAPRGNSMGGVRATIQDCQAGRPHEAERTGCTPGERRWRTPRGVR